jgi:hypothetical protein
MNDPTTWPKNLTKLAKLTDQPDLETIKPQPEIKTKPKILPENPPEATKKVDPAILDTKLYQLMKLITLICEKLEIAIPADLVLGPPPDPMQMQQVMQEQAGGMAGAAGAPPADPAAAAGGAPAPGGAPPAGGGSMAPIDPMQPAMPQDPAAAMPGKSASVIGSTFRTPEAPSAANNLMQLAQLARNMMAYAN